MVDGHYVRADITGALTPDTARQASLKARELAEQNGARKFLVNMQEAIDLFSTTERFQFVSNMRQRSCQYHERFALVFPEGHVEQQFVEDIASNRGFNLRTFYAINEAIAWLSDTADEAAQLRTP